MYVVELLFLKVYDKERKVGFLIIGDFMILDRDWKILFVV